MCIGVTVRCLATSLGLCCAAGGQVLSGLCVRQGHLCHVRQEDSGHKELQAEHVMTCERWVVASVRDFTCICSVRVARRQVAPALCSPDCVISKGLVSVNLLLAAYKLARTHAGGFPTTSSRVSDLILD